MARKDVKKKLEDFPLLLSDVKNARKEICFTDETTRSRCRGCIVLPSPRYMSADILVPGWEFDFRLAVKERTGRFGGNTPVG